MLKPSHFRTPRSLRGCHFTEGYTDQPAGTQHTGYSTAWWVVMLIIAIVSVLIIIAYGPGVQ